MERGTFPVLSPDHSFWLPDANPIDRFSSQSDRKLACVRSVSVRMYVLSSAPSGVRHVSINLRLATRSHTPRVSSVPTDLHNETGGFLAQARFRNRLADVNLLLPYSQ